MERKFDFSSSNLWYENIENNGPNNNFLEPKIVDLIFDGFLCISMVCPMQNHKISEIFWILRNIEGK